MTVRLGGVVITNPSKPLWPAEGLTKLDLAQFYSRIASQILPWLKGRPLALERCTGRRAQDLLLPASRACQPSRRSADDAPSRAGGRPPGELHHRRHTEDAAHARQLRLRRDACHEQPHGPSRSARLACLRSGSCGRIESPAARACSCATASRITASSRFPRRPAVGAFHVFVPLRRGAAQDQVQAYTAAIARELATAYPTVISVEPKKARRRAPVYVGIMSNATGQTIAPPFAVRWQSFAPVSMPLSWDEVNPRLNPGIFNIRTAERRMARKSPWSRILRPPSDAAAHLVSWFKFHGSRVHFHKSPPQIYLVTVSSFPEP